jgi:hypothetical protein
VLAVLEFLAKESIMKLDHLPYSPDLAPCDFWLFPKLKTALKGHRLSDIIDNQGTCNNHLAQHSRRGVPEMFWAVETPTHRVYWCAKRLLQTWQQPLVCK